GSNVYFVDSENLEWHDSDGPTLPGVPFPLSDGQTLTTANWSYVVHAAERLDTKLGRLWVYPIEADGRMSGVQVRVHQWYSPELGRVVKDSWSMCSRSGTCLDS